MGDVVLLLGNQAPLEVHKPVDYAQDGTPVWHAHARGDVVEDWQGRGVHRLHTLDPVMSSTTEVVIPAGETLKHVLANVAHGWDYHSTQAAGWVSVVDDGGDPARAELLRAALADHFGVPTPTGPTMLVTNAGLDYASKQLGGAASATAIAKYCGITATAITPAAGDTSLTGEITTAGGGLVRAAATYAHTVAATTYTLSITFTANASDVLPVTIKGAAFFDATSAGNMPLEDQVSPNITYNASGDAGTLTESVTV